MEADHLIFENVGNLILKNGTETGWETNTYGNMDKLSFDVNGLLQITSTYGNVIWTSKGMFAFKSPIYYNYPCNKMKNFGYHNTQSLFRI